MPIHVRANQGDYAEACLLPGDPLRAEYIAKTFMDDVRFERHPGGGMEIVLKKNVGAIKEREENPA